MEIAHLQQRTICNPLDIPYRFQNLSVGPKRLVCREAADPSVVLFCDSSSAPLPKSLLDTGTSSSIFGVRTVPPKRLRSNGVFPEGVLCSEFSSMRGWFK